MSAISFFVQESASAKAALSNKTHNANAKLAKALQVGGFPVALATYVAAAVKATEAAHAMESDFDGMGIRLLDEKGLAGVKAIDEDMEQSLEKHAQYLSTEMASNEKAKSMVGLIKMSKRAVDMGLPLKAEFTEDWCKCVRVAIGDFLALYMSRGLG